MARVLRTSEERTTVTGGTTSQKKEDFLMLLHEEHERILQKITDLTEVPVPAGETDRRKDILKDLKHDLITHMKGEEKYWYSVLDRHQTSQMDALKAEEEHRAARNVFSDLDDLDMDDNRWLPRLNVLRDLIIHHVEEEETKLFSYSREIITDEQTYDIMENFRDEKEESLGLMERMRI